MVTTLYLRDITASWPKPNVRQSTVSLSKWIISTLGGGQDGAITIYPLEMLITPGSDGNQSVRDNSDELSAPYYGWYKAWISAPLAAQTISGTLTVAFDWDEGSSSHNTFPRIKVYVWKGDDSGVRGVLYAETDSAVEADVAGGSLQTFFSEEALSSVDVQAGDRIVIEVMGYDNNTKKTSYFHAINFDGAIGSGRDSAIQFSQNLLWHSMSTIEKNLAYRMLSSTTIQKTLAYTVPFTSTIEKNLQYTVPSNTVVQKGLEYTAGSTITFKKDISYSVPHPRVIPEDVTYAIQTSTTIQRDLSYSAATASIIQKYLACFVSHSTVAQGPLQYAVPTETGIQHDLIYTIPSNTVLHLDLEYTVSTAPSALIIHKDLTHSVATFQTISNYLVYAIGKAPTIQKNLVYEVRLYTEKVHLMSIINRHIELISLIEVNHDE